MKSYSSWRQVRRGCMFSAERSVFLCPLVGAESDTCGRNGRWKGLIFRHNRIHVQNQGAVLRKVAPAGCAQPIFRLGRMKTSVDQSAQLISRWMKMGTLLCRQMNRVHPVVSFTLHYMRGPSSVELTGDSSATSTVVVSVQIRMSPKEHVWSSPIAEYGSKG